MPAAWKPEAVTELLRLARAGDSWEAIGAYFYPQSANAWRAARSAAQRFAHYAAPEDRLVRRSALYRRNFNQLPGLSPRAMGRRAERRLDDLPVQRERFDRLRGMGLCFQ